MDFRLRRATIADVPLLEEIIAESIRGLSSEDYTHEQIEGALGNAFGVDSQLINDGTYFVVEDAATGAVACGGWSFRGTLFGGDHNENRQSGHLDPQHEAARVRAFFVRPAYARRGIGRTLLEYCEKQAVARGFRSMELMATLTGQRLYQRCGYSGDERISHPLPNGCAIPFIPMKKSLV